MYWFATIGGVVVLLAKTSVFVFRADHPIACGKGSLFAQSKQKKQP
jgi:hypothetical protein